MTAESPAVRILLADDHPIFRMGLRALIEQDPELRVVAEVGSPLDLTEWLHSHPCDLLVTDFMMPVGDQQDGLRLLEYVQRFWPTLPVLVVTSMVNPGLLRAVLNAGVRGILGKGSLMEELPKALCQLRRNKLFIARSVTHVLMESGENRINPLYEQEPLSPRELEVTRLFAAGLSVGQIAAAVNRSKQTVSAQKSTAMRKLGVPSDAALFIYLQEHHVT